MHTPTEPGLSNARETPKHSFVRRSEHLARGSGGTVDFPRRQGGKYGIGLEIDRQGDDGFRRGYFKRSGEAPQIEKVHHVLRAVSSGLQGQTGRGPRPPRLVPGRKVTWAAREEGLA